MIDYMVVLGFIEHAAVLLKRAAACSMGFSKIK
jgi:hypothetical protein